MWRRLGSRIALSAIVALAADALPLGWVVGPFWRPAQTAVAVVLLVCLVGKALVDTFFFERQHRP